MRKNSLEKIITILASIIVIIFSIVMLKVGVEKRIVWVIFLASFDIIIALIISIREILKK